MCQHLQSLQPLNDHSPHSFFLRLTGTLAALDKNTLSENIQDISLQQVHNRGIYPPSLPFATFSSHPLVRSIGDRLNSPPGRRRIPGVKKVLTEFEDTGILIRSGKHFRLTPRLQSVSVPRPSRPVLV